MTEYISAAMWTAQFRQLADGSWIGSVPGFVDVSAEAATEDACYVALRGVLERAVLCDLELGRSVPEVDGLVPLPRLSRAHAM